MSSIPTVILAVSKTICWYMLIFYSVLMMKGDVCLFDENLQNVSVCFKTKGGVSVISPLK